MIDFPNDLLDKYEIIEQLGEGGMGFVFKVIPIGIDNEIALKCCKFLDEDSIRRFKREVRAIRGVDHKNVMKILDMNLDCSPPYYTMPLARYSTFDILEELSLNREKSIQIFLEVCQGVQALHNAGECHRDIKPQNIMVMTDGSIVVSDFGLAKFMDRDSTILTKTTALLGTEIYMAPEQFLPEGARNADAKTDVYQLGKTLYHLYTGKTPALLSDDGVPAGLWYIIQKAVKQNPSDRFSSVAELIDSINDYKASLDPHHNPEESFSLILQEINDKLVNNIYEKHNVEALIMLLMEISDDDDFFLQLFDQIPSSLLRSVVSDMPADVEPLLAKYVEIIERSIGGRSFSYAETVATKMSKVYKATSNISIKQGALTSVLCAAVDLNRFKAMNVFNSLLADVSSQEEALIVSDVLKQQLRRYRYVYSQISKGQLHPLLQVVWDLARGQ
ncbi:serine/threonine protein kinase [Dehalobacter sp. DCM]|uniref:serine/threonine protein kinase n=1 Tax=Dehalobacter sp. DCM TaxID=2907827 RepID=UPI0030812D5F|nr:serine/threonine protein kinase [Dehalobacter sp. DCM]